MAVLQRRNPEMVELLRGDFQYREEPNFSFKSVVSAFSALPGLIGLWPMSFVRRDSNTDRARDISGGSYHLTASSTAVTFNYTNLIPFVFFTAASSTILSRADGGAANWADVTGTEGYIASANRGLTIGCWVYPTVTTAASVMSKWGAAGQRSYELRVNGTSQFAFLASDDGTNSDTATSAAFTANNWYLVVGRFDPSTNVEIIVNNTLTQTVTARASIFDSTADFYIGARSTGANFMDGRVSMAFLSAAYISDAILGALWEQTRVMFGR